jgi:hypothetical protein
MPEPTVHTFLVEYGKPYPFNTGFHPLCVSHKIRMVVTILAFGISARHAQSQSELKQNIDKTQAPEALGEQGDDRLLRGGFQVFV